jgi:threonylcarbamoyladenosine tRNA methylthiotransferase MtaB
MRTFHLVSFGCRASQADGAALKGQLLAAGLEEAASAAATDIAVVNTCTVTATADAEVRQIIRRIHRANRACRILVTGCYAQRAPHELAALEGVAWVVGNSHKHSITELLRDGIVPTDSPPVAAPAGLRGLVTIGPLEMAEIRVGAITDDFHFTPAFPDDRSRPTLKVQDGCNARCSFCVIPAVRGDSRSLDPERVLEEVKTLVAAGYPEVVISGINLGSYGRDFTPRLNFIALLERILDETALPRLRISSIEPMDVTPELIRLVATTPRLAQHFHVPLQSGSDRILRLMNRRYWTTQYLERLLAIRDQIPDCGIGADVMVGFPGEAEEDHLASVQFIELLPLTYVHVFPYSRRPGTPAAQRPNQVNGRVAHERGREIRAIVELKRQSFLESQLGTALSVVVLANDEKDDQVSSATNETAPAAISTNYLKVRLPQSAPAPRTLLDVQIGRVSDGMLYGFVSGNDGMLA